ncbi:MAG: class I SAM-dependent methyltransferase [Pirellulales bacterium]|nr:class I SAM-dependent methyltransferase [Pirellulales bacterium]
MNAIPRQIDFERLYEGQPRWDIGRPHRAFEVLADRINGSIVDVGCGTGENSLAYAARGHEVLGVDFIPAAIAQARAKAEARRVAVEFLVYDALQLAALNRVFDQAFDSGLFHVFDDADRARYVDQLAQVVRPGGWLFLSCFSDAEPPGEGPRRVSESELRDSFTSGWTIESIRPTRYEVTPVPDDLTFSKSGPRAWFCEIRRV